MATLAALGLRQRGVDGLDQGRLFRHRAGLPYPLAGLRAGMRFEQVDAVVVAGRQHHTLGNPEAHLARRQVGDHHRQSAFQRLRGVGGADAGEDVAGLAADIQRQAQQLVGPLDILGLGDPRDPQVDLGEVIEGNLVGDRVVGKGPLGVDLSFCSSTRSSFDASIMASMRSVSTRVIKGLNLAIA